jgi:nicotinate-nucleotide adenylyltransferase
MRRLGLDEVWWLVSPQNPLKGAAGMAPMRARLASARAVARHPRVKPMDIEVRLGTRYAVDTVRALKVRFPKVRFVWLMGADLLCELHRWKDWRGLAGAVPLVVVGRPGFVGPGLRAPASLWLRRWRRRGSRWTEGEPPAMFLLDIRQTPLSATMQRLAEPDWARRFGA